MEVMGFAVLPSRLKEEMRLVRKYLLNEELTKEELDKIEVHKEFANQIKSDSLTVDNVDMIVSQAIIDVFTLALEDCAMFKGDNVNILKEAIKNLFLVSCKVNKRLSHRSSCSPFGNAFNSSIRSSFHGAK